MAEQLISIEENAQLLDFVARLTPQWLAGFFDGEGCVCIHGPEPFRLTVSVGQKRVGILAIISLKFPTKVSPYQNGNFRLSWCGIKAIPFLNFIKDFVIVKKREVEVGLEFIDTIGNYTDVTVENMTKRRKLREELLKLNQDG